MSVIVPKHCKIVNSTILIDEIKKRPLLYDPRKRPSTTENRKAMWDEVAQALYDERWLQLNDDEKECLVKSLQTKWKSLRDSFTRILRKEKQEELDGVSQNAKRKRYLYYDQLMFLAPYCGTKNYSNVIYLEESQNSNDSNLFLEEDEEEPEDETTNAPLQFIQIQSNPEPLTTPPNQDPVGVKEENGNQNSRVADALEEIVKMQKSDRSEDPMGNKKFLLSLLPFMQKLPDDVNLEVRLQLMSVIQMYASGKTLNL